MLLPASAITNVVLVSLECSHRSCVCSTSLSRGRACTRSGWNSSTPCQRLIIRAECRSGFQGHPARIADSWRYPTMVHASFQTGCRDLHPRSIPKKTMTNAHQLDVSSENKRNLPGEGACRLCDTLSKSRRPVPPPWNSKLGSAAKSAVSSFASCVSNTCVMPPRKQLNQLWSAHGDITYGDHRAVLKKERTSRSRIAGIHTEQGASPHGVRVNSLYPDIDQTENDEGLTVFFTSVESRSGARVALGRTGGGSCCMKTSLQAGCRVDQQPRLHSACSVSSFVPSAL